MLLTFETTETDHIRAALRIHAQKIQDILDAIESNDADPQAVQEQIRLAAGSLRRLLAA